MDINLNGDIKAVETDASKIGTDIKQDIVEEAKKVETSVEGLHSFEEGFLKKAEIYVEDGVEKVVGIKNAVETKVSSITKDIAAGIVNDKKALYSFEKAFIKDVKADAVTAKQIFNNILTGIISFAKGAWKFIVNAVNHPVDTGIWIVIIMAVFCFFKYVILK